jgi:hypothetical protein
MHLGAVIVGKAVAGSRMVANRDHASERNFGLRVTFWTSPRPAPIEPLDAEPAPHVTVAVSLLGNVLVPLVRIFLKESSEFQSEGSLVLWKFTLLSRPTFVRFVDFRNRNGLAFPRSHLIGLHEKPGNL